IGFDKFVVLQFFGHFAPAIESNDSRFSTVIQAGERTPGAPASWHQSAARFKLPGLGSIKLLVVSFKFKKRGRKQRDPSTRPPRRTRSGWASFTGCPVVSFKFKKIRKR